MRFWILVQNGGGATDTFTIQGCSGNRVLKVRRVPARQARCETWSTSVDDPDAQDVVVAEMTSS